MSVIKFFHHLFNPHCKDCLDNERCESCDTLRDQLVIERANNERLLRALLEPKDIEREVVDTKEYKPVHNLPTWDQTRRRLEAESRAKAEQIRAAERDARAAAPADKEIEQLEKKLGVENG